MSSKKDRWNHRRYYRRLRNWSVPRWYRRLNKIDGTRLLRARARQLIREGRFDLFPRYRRDSGWHYW